MADHQMIHPPAAATTGSKTHGHAGDWWTTTVSCSPDQLPDGFGGAGWSSAAATTAAEGNRSRSGNAAASSESPGSIHSLPTAGSSITFQESAVGAAVGDQGVVAMPPHPVASGHAGSSWNQPSYYFDQQAHHLSLRSPSSNNTSTMVPDSHHDDPNHQFLSNLGLELLSSSPTSSSGGFRTSSSLLRSLTEPSAVATGFQQYQQQAVNQAPPESIRDDALQFVNSTPFWSASAVFASAAEGATSRLPASAAGPPSAQSMPANFAVKSALLEGARGDSSSITANKTSTDPTPRLKKSRTGTPSPLPATFKVRKEKLGDRITALQQLVSPFGKVCDPGLNLVN
uniref:Transcription factor bHLH112 n=1 Tax=Zea mays TaxID=4577 RepID=C4JB21_MAIZE|nr:unknown [Zea mays]